MANATMPERSNVRSILEIAFFNNFSLPFGVPPLLGRCILRFLKSITEKGSTFTEEVKDRLMLSERCSMTADPCSSFR